MLLTLLVISIFIISIIALLFTEPFFKPRYTFKSLYLTHWETIGNLKGGWCPTITLKSFDNTNTLKKNQSLDEALYFLMHIINTYSTKPQKQTDLDVLSKLSSLNNIPKVNENNFSVYYFDFTDKWKAKITLDYGTISWEHKDLDTLINLISNDLSKDDPA